MLHNGYGRVVKMVRDHVIKIWRGDIPPWNKVEWLCRCEGYSLLASEFKMDPSDVEPVCRNVADMGGSKLRIVPCRRCGREWTIMVYDRDWREK